MSSLVSRNYNVANKTVEKKGILARNLDLKLYDTSYPCYLGFRKKDLPLLFDLLMISFKQEVRENPQQGHRQK